MTGQEARALSYDVSYSHERSNFLRRVRILPLAGGTGETLIERWKIRISPTFSFLWTTFRPTLTEESFTVAPDGVKNGPVRAIRRVRKSLDLAAGSTCLSVALLRRVWAAAHRGSVPRAPELQVLWPRHAAR